MRGDNLVNQKQFYTGVSRAKFDAHIYTDDIHALRLAVARDWQKEIAIDAVQLRQSAPTQQQHPQQSQSMGMRI